MSLQSSCSWRWHNRVAAIMRSSVLLGVFVAAVVAAALIRGVPRTQPSGPEAPLTGTLSAEELELELERWIEVQSAAMILEAGCGEGECGGMEEAGTREVERVHNYATGETWWFGHVHNETDTSFEMYEGMEPKGFVNVEHVHPQQAEQVVLLQGVVRCTWQERNDFVWHTGLLYPGQWISVPAGMSHALENAATFLTPNSSEHSPEGAADDVVIMRVRYTPGTNDMKAFFRSLGRLSQTPFGLTWLPGMPGLPDPIHTALLWSRFPDLSQFWWMPAMVQNSWAVVGTAIGSLVGAEL